jgi:hypothetical protein
MRYNIMLVLVGGQRSKRNGQQNPTSEIGSVGPDPFSLQNEREQRYDDK